MIQREIVKFVRLKEYQPMDRIIQYAQERIDACVHCQARFACEWFQEAKKVVLDVTPEKYAEMTYEEIANAIHADMVVPDESCDQVSFDTMMQTVDDLLQEATVPSFSDDLRKLLQKMVQLERRLNRLPSDCRDVFDAPIRAIVERCLGRRCTSTTTSSMKPVSCVPISISCWCASMAGFP